jgi:hypothetical protein
MISINRLSLNIEPLIFYIISNLKGICSLIRKKTVSAALATNSLESQWEAYSRCWLNSSS